MIVLFQKIKEYAKNKVHTWLEISKSTFSDAEEYRNMVFNEKWTPKNALNNYANEAAVNKAHHQLPQKVITNLLIYSFSDVRH